MMRRACTLVTTLSLVVVACTSTASNSPNADGAAGDSGADSQDGGAPNASQAGAAGDFGSVGESGAASETGAAGDSGNGGTSTGPKLPEGTLLYVRHETADQDVLVALDLDSGDERVVTDLTGDGSSGWEIDGYALSPDRRRIALASLYAPTAADTATGLATRAIWTLTTDGRDFRRLTPTFPNDAQGRKAFQHDVGGPEWTASGAEVLYDFGTYWYEGTTLKGATFPWLVAADGKQLPSSFPTSADCSILHPARNPVTGELLFIHSVCIPGQGDGDGLYLYPADGSTNPQQIISSTRAADGIDVFLAKPSWFADGSGFLFIGGTADTDWRPSLLAYDGTENKVGMLVPAATGETIYSVSISADASKIVYCVHDNDSGDENLRLIDLSGATATDSALTTDGKSCDPSF
jgi:hypothetical protein